MPTENLLDEVTIDDGNEEDKTLSQQVEAAFDAVEKGSGNPPPDKPVAGAKASPDSSDDRPRQPDGKFAPKLAASESTAAPVQRNTAQTPAPSGTASAATRKAPASWSSDPAKWETLDPAIQEYFLKRETEVSAGMQERAERIKSLEERSRSYGELDQVYAPYVQKWAQQGITPAQATKNLLNAQAYIERDPINALLWLQQSTRVDPAHLIAALSQPPAQRQQQAYASAAQQQQQHLVMLQRQIDEMQVAPIRNEIETFKAAPGHEHFALLQPQMHYFVQSGQAPDLQTAYDLALFANPQTRDEAIATRAAAEAKAIRDQEAEQRKAANGARTAQAAQAAQARRAAVTIRGAPRGGTATARVGGKNIFADAEAAYDAVQS